MLAPPAGCDLVFTKDMMVSGRHFFADDPADLVARKLLRVNLSDLAAMGARPLGYLLGFAFPDHLDEALARDFCRGLAQDQAEFGLRLYGGDTVSGAGSLILSLTAIGAVGQGRALRRKGAQPGDDVYVSGAIGEAALGLKALLGTLPPAVARIPDFAAIKDALINRYHLPRPRVALGMALAGHASAAIDISDGLLADLGHICEQSDCAMEIEAGRCLYRMAGGWRFIMRPNCGWIFSPAVTIMNWPLPPPPMRLISLRRWLMKPGLPSAGSAG